MIWLWSDCSDHLSACTVCSSDYSHSKNYNSNGNSQTYNHIIRFLNSVCLSFQPYFQTQQLKSIFISLCKTNFIELSKCYNVWIRWPRPMTKVSMWWPGLKLDGLCRSCDTNTGRFIQEVCKVASARSYMLPCAFDMHETWRGCDKELAVMTLGLVTQNRLCTCVANKNIVLPSREINII